MRHAGLDFQAKRLKVLCHDSGGAELTIGEFRVFVKIASPGHDLVRNGIRQIPNFIERHGVFGKSGELQAQGNQKDRNQRVCFHSR